MATRIYHDIPLDPARGDIRLLRVHKLPNGRISYVLKRFILAPSPEVARKSHIYGDHSYYPLYRTISYTWGNPHPATSILLNGIEHTLGPNLYAILDFIAVGKEVWQLQEAVRSQRLWCFCDSS